MKLEAAACCTTEDGVVMVSVVLPCGRMMSFCLEEMYDGSMGMAVSLPSRIGPHSILQWEGILERTEEG